MSGRPHWISLLGSSALAVLVALLPGTWAAQEQGDSIEVSDQPIVDGSITFPGVTASQEGWIVAHVDEGGRPGRVIGFTPVKKGENRNVVIKLDEAVPVGGALWPMLHVDSGTIGVYEFPGPDAPVIVNGDFLVKRMVVTVGGTSAGVPNVVSLALGALALLVVGGMLAWRMRRRT